MSGGPGAASSGSHRAPWLSLDPVAMALASMRWMATAASFLPFAGRGLTALECANKIAAFEGFQAGRRSLAGPPSVETLLAALAANARLPAYPRLWQLEGIGYGWAELSLARGEEPRRLLSPSRVGELPRAFRVPLHTGLGLKLATHALDDGRGEVAGMVAGFWRQCRDNGREGYEEVCFEALGLAVRILRPGLRDQVAAHLAQVDRRRHALFWHGVGRALYFLPSNLMLSIGAEWSGLRRALAEPADDEGRNNALAGLGWAQALVNLRHPRIVVDRWLRLTARWPDRSIGRPLGHGAACALAIWNEHAGTERYLEAFLHCGETIAAADQREAWHRYLAAPLSQLLGGPVAPAMPGALFTDRGLSEVLAAMAGEERPPVAEFNDEVSR